MASFFKDMFSGRPFAADLADGDWSPVPVGTLAAPRTMPPPPPLDWVGVLRRFAEHMTDEELSIVRRQLAPH